MSTVAKQLRAAADGLAEAARKDAIEPDGPLGHWVQSQTAILHAQADLAEHIEQQVTEVISEFHNLAKVEVQKMREIIRGGHLALESAKTAQASFEVQKEMLLAKVVNTMAPQMIKAVGEAVVIRERRYNQRVHWGRAAGIAAVAGCLLLGGYIWGGWGLGTTAANATELQKRVKQCQASPVLDDRTHEAYCPLTALTAP